MTPEEIRAERLRRKRLARFRFKCLVRMVMCNQHWLSELEEQKLGDNVKRNVAIILRRSGYKSIISIKDKRLLNKPIEYRTNEDKLRLVSIVMDLKCFQDYSPVIRSRLARVVHFLYFEQGRVILREGHFPSAMYFILDGEVTVSKQTWMPYEEKYADKVLNVLSSGEMFGQVELLENRKRLATCTSSTHTELLCVFIEDFNNILKSTLQLQWDQIKMSLKRFEYFSTWTDDQIQECCILSRIKQYDPLQTIYSQDKGQLNNVFFVLSGSCNILQCLKLKSVIKGKKKQYKLVDVGACRSYSQELMESIHKAADNRREMEANKSDEQTINRKTKELLRESMISLRESKAVKEKSGSIIQIVDADIKENYDYQFVEVGRFSCGSVFGLGEEMVERAIVARNTVQCLLVPRYWLFEKSQNLGNIWQRTKMYLDSSIPSRKKVFEDYKNTKKWKAFKKDIIDEIVTRNPTSNLTTILDVPIICRIEEGL